MKRILIIGNVSHCDDRLYLIDAQHESCVHEYKIVERN